MSRRRASDAFTAVGADDRASAHAGGSSTAHTRTAVAVEDDAPPTVAIESGAKRSNGDIGVSGHADDQSVSVAEAARLLGRDRTRVYALLRSADLVAAAAANEDESGPVLIERSSIERWLEAGGDGGRPLSPRNAWAFVGLASGDQPFSERCVGLLEHPEELSRT